ncbi:MAG: phenylalanine--tRNA ligase subunit beta [Candidatus Pacebacteria bacterium]|nr:phenylalanine--tRNA ligase subunit beta [Candidatus Paceibacterota bacterium]
MNILIPHKWLLEHLDSDVSPEELQKTVSLSGPSIERIYDREGDKVYDIEVTTNRVDSMSIRGIAREAAVILNQFGHKAKLKDLDKNEIEINTDKTLPLPKIVNDPQVSKRISCVILRDVKRTPTPKWMADRLLQTEMNVHDSVIDITNYITHELGHPCHAFDYDKVMNTGGEIIVTEAGKGEKFSTLDGNEFTTLGGEVVFKNGEGEIIDLPSIKGTANTSIDDSTKNVLLLLESIVAPKVRFASMSHAIRTTAAQLMEKNVDPNLIPLTLEFGVKLYTELCEAQVASEVYDDFPGQVDLKPLSLSLTKIQNYLGLSLETKTIEKILQDLGCEVKIEDEKITVQPPTFRPDLAIPADIIEEIARIYGYHNLPSVLMESAIPLEKPKDINFAIENKIKRFMAAIGWQEIYSYSMVSEEIALESGNKLDDHLKLQNPLTDDRVYLRRSLIPSLVEVIKMNPLEKNLSVFEIANVYHPQKEGELPNEQLHLTLVSSNSYRKVRGDLESMLAQLFITKTEISKGGDIVVEGQRIGQVTQIENLISLDIEFKKLLHHAKTHPTYKAIPKTSTINEDMTFQIDDDISIGKVITEIKEQSPLLTVVKLKDQYKSNYTFSLEYHDPTKNLSGSEIEPIRKEITNSISKKFSAKLIGLVE